MHFITIAHVYTKSYPLPLHDALPIYTLVPVPRAAPIFLSGPTGLPCLNRISQSEPSRLTVATSSFDSALATGQARSEEHTSELQSRFDLVCRLMLEKKN